MADLLFKSLYIDQFRCFNDFTIEKFGRVNLIVGKNNIGKTNLLEAIRLYSRRAHPVVISQLLEQRDEFREPFLSGQEEDDERVLSFREERVAAIRQLFLDGNRTQEDLDPILIGPVRSSKDTLSIALRWGNIHVDRNARIIEQRSLFSDSMESDTTKIVPYLEVKLEGDTPLGYPLSRSLRESSLKIENINSGIYIPANGLTTPVLSRMWDDIALTDKEDNVLDVLRVISTDIERLNFVADQDIHQRRIPRVRMKQFKNPIPLKRLGEGMHRMLGLGLSLVSAEGGVLLIDEIESGLHYSVQLDMWRLIFKLAARLNVQVFATTHSWDCIKAFQRAAKEDEQQEGMLIRLTQKQGRIISTLFSEAELTVITRKNIEVR